jgi:hypothetical protein
MKLPINFQEFKTDPVKALMFLLLFVVLGLYWRSESQAKQINTECQKRLTMCEVELRKLSKSLKTQDSICSALITELKIYKQLGKI